MSTCVYEIVCPSCGFIEEFNNLDNYIVLVCFRCGVEIKIVNPFFEDIAGLD